MARKKQEIALQNEIESQEEWEEALAKEGLTIIDVYQEWCGPCKSVLSLFKRIKNETGDDLLHFSIAKCDTVDALEKYRGKCKPCFLFYAGGSLVKVIRGTNVPLLQRNIIEQLAQERKVLDGDEERKEIRDPDITYDEPEKGEEDEDESEKDEEIESIQKEVSVAIIKPNIVAAGRVTEIIKEMQEAGLEILQEEERLISEEECKEFYDHKKDEPYFDDLVKYMTEGPSHILVISKQNDSGEGVLEQWRHMLGPANVNEAKEAAPESLRAKYGADGFMNALHGSDSKERAVRELAFFFPNFHIPTTSRSVGGKPKIQRTIALVRPDAYNQRRGSIMDKIVEAGFKVALSKEIQLSKEQAEDFYKEHKEQPYFDELTNGMSKGPLLALALARDDAVTGWREAIGPTEVDKAKEEAPNSLRAQFSIEGVGINQIHGSDSIEKAEEELEYFFPSQKTVALIKPDAYQTKEEIMDKIREAGFRIAARKETEIPRELAEQLYKGQEGKDFFNDLVDHVTSGPTLCMVLNRNDAVDGWRGLMGPTDPTVAKNDAPDSIRANFGHDILKNAVHGSSDVEEANKTIELLFGEIDESQGEDAFESSKQAEEEQAKEEGEETVAEEGEKADEEQGAEEEEGEKAAEDNEAEQQEEGAEDEEKGDQTEKSNDEQGDEEKQEDKGEAAEEEQKSEEENKEEGGAVSQEPEQETKAEEEPGDKETTEENTKEEETKQEDENTEEEKKSDEETKEDIKEETKEDTKEETEEVKEENKEENKEVAEGQEGEKSESTEEKPAGEDQGEKSKEGEGETKDAIPEEEEGKSKNPEDADAEQ